MSANVIPSNVEKVTALRRTDVFNCLSSAVLDKVSGLTTTRHLDPGQILYSEHEEASALFVVSSGEIRSIRQNLEGREQVLSTVRPGGILAAVPVLNGGGCYSTAIAETKSEVLGIEKLHVHELCRQHTEFLWNLTKLLARNVRDYAEIIESLALRSVDQRVAHYLVMNAQQRGIPVNGGCIVELTLTRTELANRLGSAREVVSRAFTRLQNYRLIRMEGCRLVTVTDMKALRDFGGISIDEPAYRGA